MRSKPSIRVSKGSTVCTECGKEKLVGKSQHAFLCNACYLRKNHLEVRKRVISHFGGKCKCCGESRYEFLAFDHINGGGQKHRRERNISNLEAWLHANKKRSGRYPRGFQILCHNCNLAKGFYLVCPHVEERRQNERPI